MNRQSPAQRAAAKRNLLNAIVDAAVDRELIDLEGDESEKVVFDLVIADLPAIGCVQHRGDELTVHGIVAPTELGKRFVCCLIHFRRHLFGEVCATGWLNYRTGQFGDYSGGFFGSNAIVPLLANLSRQG